MGPSLLGECPVQKRKRDQSSVSLHHVRVCEKAAVCKPGSGLLPRPASAGTLILDVQNGEKYVSFAYATQSVVFCQGSLN